MKTILKIGALALALAATSGCVELAVGAAGAVIADEALEQRNGDDGLF